jgi:hypothetical protein
VTTYDFFNGIGRNECRLALSRRTDCVTRSRGHDRGFPNTSSLSQSVPFAPSCGQGDLAEVVEGVDMGQEPERAGVEDVLPQLGVIQPDPSASDKDLVERLVRTLLSAKCDRLSSVRQLPSR